VRTSRAETSTVGAARGKSDLHVQSIALTRPGLQFTERMKGWFSTAARDGEYQAGWDVGRAEGSTLEAELTITVDDLEKLLNDPAIPSDLQGSVLAPTLSPHALTVTEGEFRLFEPDPEWVETWKMRYRMQLIAKDGNRYRLEGFKDLHDDPGFDTWVDTTKLFFQIFDENDGASGAGILRLSPADLIRQLRTVRVIREPEARSRRKYLRRFVAMFARRLAYTYGVLDEDGRFWGKPVQRKPVEPTPGRTPDLVLWCDGDGRWHEESRRPTQYARHQLTRFEGGRNGPVLLAPGFAMAARSFAMTTNPTNLVAYLIGKQYDVWLFDYRASIELPSANEYFTFDDVAREDWPAAVREVLRRSKAKDVQVIGHCAGSVTFLMAMLAGLTGVRSAVCSQFTLHPRSWWFNRAKVWMPLPQLLQRFRVPSLSPNTLPTPWNKLLDIALAPLPVPRGERCGSALCRWLNLVYGMTHHHERLNDATHRAMVDSFGVGNLRSIEHLGLIFRKGRAVDIHGEDVYMRHPERLAIPINFLVGKKNTIFYPASTNETLHWLRRHNYPPSLYTTTELENYAHLDCFMGEHAAKEVFPRILEHLAAHPGATSQPGPGAE
jgi:cholesterol oxidase